MSTAGPLDGVALTLAGSGPAVGTAVAWAARLGARVGAGGETAPGARLVGGARPDLAGVPPGTLDLAAAGALLGAGLAGWWSGRRLEVDVDAVAAQVLLPLVVSAETGTEAAAGPSAPRPCGSGALCAELTDEDRDAFDRLLGVLGPGDHRPEVVAARAQEWRLPVTPYRARPRLGRQPGSGRAAADARPWCDGGWGAARGARPGHAPGSTRRSRLGPPLAGVAVVDLTTMWSGPLTTWLLATLGAEVTKVEPACRPDGLRRSPGGHLFAALNEGKAGVALDLRRPADGDAFAELVRRADLVVDNLSPRAAANLGLADGDARGLGTHDVGPRTGEAATGDPCAGRAGARDAGGPAPARLGLPAFDAGSPERCWVAYGTGVHAVSGLGDTEAGPSAPAVTYPDPVTGFTGFAAALTLLVAREVSGRAPARAEVTLARAIAPLLAVPRPVEGALLRRDPAAGHRLAAHHHRPFSGDGLPVALATAPAPPAAHRMSDHRVSDHR